MSGEPLISIVTPSFNMARFLERALESVHGQSDRVEHIVVDGGSTDESPTIIESWSRRLAWRVSQPDRGQSDAINKGFQIARGRFGAWLNADDWYEPGALEHVVEALETEPEVDVLVGRCRFVDEEGQVVFAPEPPDPVSVDHLLRLRTQWFHGRLLVQPEVFFRLSLFRRVGGLDVDNHHSMDHDLWLRLLDAGARVRTLDRHVANLGVHVGQKTSDNMASVASILDHSTRFARTRPVARDARAEIDAMATKHRVTSALLDAWRDVQPGDPSPSDALRTWSAIDEPANEVPAFEELVAPLHRAFRWKRQVRALLVATAPSAIGDEVIDLMSKRRLDLAISTPSDDVAVRWISDLDSRTGRFSLTTRSFEDHDDDDEPWDIVFLHDILHRLPDLEAALDRWRRTSGAVVSLCEPAASPPIDELRSRLAAQVSANDDVLFTPDATEGLGRLASRILDVSSGVFRAAHARSGAIELPDATVRLTHGGFDAHPLVRADIGGTNVLQSCTWID